MKFIILAMALVSFSAFAKRPDIVCKSENDYLKVIYESAHTDNDGATLHIITKTASYRTNIPNRYEYDFDLRNKSVSFDLYSGNELSFSADGKVTSSQSDWDLSAFTCKFL